VPATPGDPRPIYDFAVEGAVQAEVFVLWLDGDGIMLTGPCGPEAWYLELGTDDDPIETVTRLLRANLTEPQIVHSTSWRRARGGVILSFVTVVPRTGAVGLASRPITRVDLARGGATSAPDTIQAGQVLEHGLRHLAWLIGDDAVVRGELGAGWAAALAGYVPEPFRHLGAVLS
jgi:hypothetical protein